MLSETIHTIGSHVLISLSLSDAPLPFKASHQVGKVVGLFGELDLSDEGLLGLVPEVESFLVHGSIVMYCARGRRVSFLTCTILRILS